MNKQWTDFFLVRQSEYAAGKGVEKQTHYPSYLCNLKWYNNVVIE